jgi:alkylation response protein AidB-like acyl-CoA dehydrogenase
MVSITFSPTLPAHSLSTLPPRRRITNGIYSDYFTTAVRTSGKAGETNGISFLLIPKTEGVTCKRMLMSGQWCAGTTFVTFEDVKVPAENLIGTEGAGFKMIMTNVSSSSLETSARRAEAAGCLRRHAIKLE